MYQETTLTVTDGQASGSTLTLNNLTFTHPQTYILIRLTDDATGERIHPTKVQIFSGTEKIIKTKAIDGTTTYFDNANPLTINTVMEDGEYPGEVFVSLYNDNGRSDAYRLKAWVGEDIYVGPTNRALTAISNNGVLGNLPRTMTKTTPSTSLSIASIPDQSFTGYAIEPALTVTDGADELVVNTDYAAAYTSNVNIGEATVTIKGLADAGATAATKYIGTQSATFRIVKATPKFEFDTTDMELIYNGSGETRAVTRVYIDNNGNNVYDAGIDYDITGMSGVTVSYVSSTTSVATVDPATGAVQPAGQGVTVITVSIPAGANWNSYSVTYNVQVRNTAGGTLDDYNDGGSEWSD